jgi:hypothetical protein
VRVEGDEDAFAIYGLGVLHYLLQNRFVAQMHAIESAYGEHCIGKGRELIYIVINGHEWSAKV